jgi:hypothetical protein
MDVVANSEMAVGQGRLARGRSGQSVVISLHQIATLSSSVLLEKKKNSRERTLLRVNYTRLPTALLSEVSRQTLMGSDRSVDSVTTHHASLSYDASFQQNSGHKQDLHHDRT